MKLKAKLLLDIPVFFAILNLAMEFGICFSSTSVYKKSTVVIQRNIISK